MAAGLPGTGIGGLFFILSAFFMVIVELHRTIRGQSSLAAWRIVGRQAGIAAAMIVAVTVVVWLLHRLLFPSTAAGGTGSGSTPATDQLVPFAPVLITLAVLMTVLVTAYLAKFVFGESGPVRQVADHRAAPERPQHPEARFVQPLPLTALIQVCNHLGCSTLCLGPICIDHAPRTDSSSFVRGRPWPPADERVLDPHE